MQRLNSRSIRWHVRVQSTWPQMYWAESSSVSTSSTLTKPKSFPSYLTHNFASICASARCLCRSGGLGPLCFVHHCETRWSITTYCMKQRHHFAEKGPSSQSYGFSSSHIWMWELDHKGGWVPKNWCFQTVMLEKTLENPLDGKDIKTVNPKGNQPWIFIERTDAEAEAPILWPPGVKS